MSEKKKIEWRELIVVTALVFLASVVTFGLTWYVLDKSTKENQEVSDVARASLQARIIQLEQKLKAYQPSGETKEVNKIYQGTEYKISYPAAWVYRVYNDSAAALVAFAPTESTLPAANSDQMPIISTSVANKAATAEELTSETKYASKTASTIGGNISATVWTLAAGRPNDLNGAQKIVIYEVKLPSGKYLRIENVGDKNQDTFQQMLKTVQLN